MVYSMDIQLSVVIPVYNNAQYINRCLASVISQEQDMEIIIVDDASTDNIKQAVSSFHSMYGIMPVFIQNSQRRGAAMSRNNGVKASSGTHVAFLDADDWWEDNKTKKQMDLVRNGSVFTYTGRKNVNEDSGRERIISVPEHTDIKTMLAKNPVSCSSVILERGLAMDYPMICPELCEDFLTWIRIMQDGIEADGINLPLLNYAIRSSSVSHNKAKHAWKRFLTYKKAGIPLYQNIFYSVYYPVSKIMHL